ncbi:phosphohydrolase [Methylobacterium sp. JK268]
MSLEDTLLRDEIALVTRAADFAARRHTGQRRKGAAREPYVNHLAEVTDDKSLPKAERKLLQVARAQSASPGARIIKLADKISNLRSLAASPPEGWDRTHVLDYVTWAERVVAGCRGTSATLESIFDQTAIAVRRAV